MSAPRPDPTDKDNVFRFDQSGALLRKVMENAAVGMVLVGVDGRSLYANKAFGEMLGYEPADCAGLPFDALVHADDEAVAKLQMQRLARGEIEDYRAEHQYRHKDGSPIWVSVAVSVLDSDTTGQPLYLIVQITNIDAQKRAEAALAYNETLWSSALDAARTGVWAHDIRTNAMTYSRMWRLMRGFGPDEEIDGAQDVWISRLHPDDRERILAIVNKQDKGEEGHDVLEYRERHRDGHYIWILSRGKPVEWDANGVPVRTVGTDTDITRLKTAEIMLDEEKERLRVTLDSIADGVISTDAERKVTFMNPSAEHMTGWVEAEAIGQPIDGIFDILEEATHSPAASPVSRCLAFGELAYLADDVQLVSRSGDSRDIRSSAAPLRDADGNIVGAVLVFQDISQSRALQRQLAHSASHDDLTGLANRPAFERALTVAVASAHDSRREHSLCFVDLDRFKPVNDSAGHAAGDALLKQVAETIRSCCRAHDLVARVGGDEFALLLSDCPLSHAESIAQKVVDSVSALAFSWGGKTYRIGACVGITAITREKASSLGTIGEADAACYAAKAAGRGRVTLFQDMPPPRED